MFEDSLFDSGAGNRPRKIWPRLLSFVVEVCAIGVLVMLLLIFSQALPEQLWTSVLENPAPPLGQAPVKVVHAQARARESRPAEDSVLRQPSYIPQKTQIVHDEQASAEGPPSMDNVVPGGIPGGVPNAVITEIARATPPPVIAKAAPPQKLRISSGVAAGLLIHQVKPQYPPLAVQARIQGTVVLQAVIGKDRRIGELRLVSGHPMLAGAAMEAVKQWRYRPYL